jgi:hypothetical protein
MPPKYLDIKQIEEDVDDDKYHDNDGDFSDADMVSGRMRFGLYAAGLVFKAVGAALTSAADSLLDAKDLPSDD